MSVTESRSTAAASEEEDRRRDARYTVQVQIEVHTESGDVPLRLLTTDLSRGGCYVRMVEQFAVGVRVRATVWLDGSPIAVQGVVATLHPAYGNGIMFMKFEGDGERLLARYLDAVTA